MIDSYVLSCSPQAKSSATCPNPSKSNPACYSHCFIFPNTESQELFVSRGEIECFFIQKSCKLVVLSYAGLKVVVPSAVDTRSSLKTTFTALRHYLRRDADVVIFNPALVNRALKATPGSCHRLVLSEGSIDQLDTVRSMFPEFQIDSFLESTKYHLLSCSSWAQGETTGDGLVRFEIDPHSYECLVEGNWVLHLAAVCIGNTETINSGDVFRRAFDRSSRILVTGAYGMLKQLEKSSGNVSKAIHLASDIAVPESILTSRDDQRNPDRVLPFPHNRESLERNQKLVSAFFHQCIQPLLGMTKIKKFAVLLFDGDVTKYDECLRLLEPLDESDELLHQIYRKYSSIAGKAIDFSKLKDVFDQMEHKELSDLCDEFLY